MWQTTFSCGWLPLLADNDIFDENTSVNILTDKIIIICKIWQINNITMKHEFNS